MAVRFTEVNYATEPDIIAFPEHCISIGYTFLKDDAKAVAEDGRKLLKAGTIYEYTDSNGNTCTGIVRHTYDVTDGDQYGAIVRHGWVRTDLMPVKPTTSDMAKMPMIEFV
jgi:hypothetical protein